MNELPGGKEIGAYVFSVVASIGAAFGVWKLQSKTKLDVTENTSRGDWLKHTEQQRDAALEREQRAIDREQRALERERSALDKVASLALRVSMLTEKTERQDRKIDMLIRILGKARPDLAEVLTSSFGDLPEPGPVE